MSPNKAIEFLSSLKYGDRALTDARKDHDIKLDEICLLLNSYIQKKPREIDPDCANGACPPR
jgi:hypothetical protein